MSPFIELLDQALQANLSKRQWAAFAAVLRQTVGFRKAEDDLSPRRLEQLTGIRRNHIWQAKKELEALGLLRSRPGHYGEILAFSSPPIPPPLVPETGAIPPVSGQPAARIGTESGPKQDTTVSNLTGNNHHTVVIREPVIDGVSASDPAPLTDPHSAVDTGPESNGLHYPPDLSARERQQAPACLDGLSPQAAQQVLDVWASKIRCGEVRHSRLGLLAALVKAQRQHRLDIRCLQARYPASLPPDKPQTEQQRLARERWLEQQAQQGWLRDMAKLSGLPPNPAVFAGGVS